MRDALAFAMRTLVQDLRHAARMLSKAPAFTVVAVATLALSIGANAVIFSLLDTMYVRSLPVPEASRLVHVFQTRADRRGTVNLSFPDYLYYRDHSEVFSELAAHYSSAPINLATWGESREINGSVVTANYFTVLGLEPALGRYFTPDEDAVPGRNPVAVISDDLWRGQLGGDAQILNKRIRLNGTDFTVVGVAPSRVHGVSFGDLAVDVWIPSAMFRVGYRYCDALVDRDCHIVSAIGRLKPGRRIVEAQAGLSVLTRQLEAAYPATDKRSGVMTVPARGVVENRDVRTPPLLAAAVGLVLLIACANIAGLLISRSLTRRREIAIRLALGAGRGRLVRQLMTESLLLGLLGGAAGLMVAFWAKDLLLIFYTANSEGQRAYFSLDPDLFVLALTFAASIVAGVVFGLVPALQASRRDVLPALKDEGVIGSARSRIRDVLVVAQVAISLVLLIGAGLLVRSLVNVYRGQGFDPRPVLLLRLRPSLVAQTPARAKAFQQSVVTRLEALPGVEAASPASYPPLPGWDDDRVRAWLPGQAAPIDRGAGYGSGYNAVGPRYFATLGVAFVAGRDFDERDRRESSKVAIVNEVVARHFWPGESPLGRPIAVDGGRYQIVGVVRAAQYRRGDEAPRPMIYANYWQTDDIDRRPIDSRTHVRVRGDARSVLRTIRREVAAIDETVPVSEDRPLTEWIDYSFGPLRAAGAMLTCFGLLAAFLSAIGLYGVLASAVRHRTREIAIRMALGADGSDVARLVIRQGVALALAGTGVGLIAAAASVRVLGSFLYGIGQYDPLATAIAPVILIGITLLASYLPALRAMRIDPMVALRYE